MVNCYPFLSCCLHYDILQSLTGWPAPITTEWTFTSYNSHQQEKIRFSLLLKNEHICSQHIQASAAGTGRATVPQNDGVSGQVPGWLSPPCLHLQRSITNQHIMPGCDYYTQTGALVSPFLLIGILTCCDFLGWTCLTRIIRPGEWLRSSWGKLCPLPILSCTPSSLGLLSLVSLELSKGQTAKLSTPSAQQGDNSKSVAFQCVYTCH